MSQQKRQRREEDDNNTLGIDIDLSSVDTTIDDVNGNEPLVKELKRKLAASESKNALHEAKIQMLEAKNQMLEGKLEIHELKAANRVLAEENKAFKLKEAEKEAQMARNHLLINMDEDDDYSMQVQEIDRALALLENIKTKRVANSKGNRWKSSNTMAIISSDGLKATTKNEPDLELNIFAVEPFPISTVAGGPCTRKDNFLGTLVFYYEVTQTAYNKPLLLIGLSDGTVPDGTNISDIKNSFAMMNGNDYCWLNGEKHMFEWPIEAIKPKWKKGTGDVVGCGILVNREDKVAIFFTGNGKLMGKQIPIVHPKVSLYPSATMWEDESLEANFGDDLEGKPFKYDIEKCEGLVFE